MQRHIKTVESRIEQQQQQQQQQHLVEPQTVHVGGPHEGHVVPVVHQVCHISYIFT